MGDEKSKSVICPAVWDHLCINTMGKNRLCCNAVTQDQDTFIENFDGHWNELRDWVKAEMISGRRPDICNSCWRKEDAGITSLREGFISNYKLSNRWDHFVNTLDVKRPNPVELDLKLGNYCNLKCRMCSSYSSSGVALEVKQIYSERGIDLGINDYEKEFTQDKWYLKKEFVDRIKAMIDDGLYHLKFTGGEPLMVPSVSTIIDYCIDNGYSENIELIIITNVTLINSKWIERFKKFKYVNIICSVDGINKTFEYIRHPAKWDNVYSKLKYLSDNQTSQLKITITFTLQIYNMLEIASMVELARELSSDINLIALDTPNYLDASNAIDTLKNEALIMLSRIEISESENNAESYSSFIKNAEKKISLPASANTSNQFVTISKLKDEYKNQNIKTIDVWKYYE